MCLPPCKNILRLVMKCCQIFEPFKIVSKVMARASYVTFSSHISLEFVQPLKRIINHLHPTTNTSKLRHVLLFPTNFHTILHHKLIFLLLSNLAWGGVYQTRRKAIIQINYSFNFTQKKNNLPTNIPPKQPTKKL